MKNISGSAKSWTVGKTPTKKPEITSKKPAKPKDLSVIKELVKQATTLCKTTEKVYEDSKHKNIYDAIIHMELVINLLENAE